MKRRVIAAPRALVALLLVLLATVGLASVAQAVPVLGADPVKIYPLGDSITMGLSNVPGGSPGGYRTTLDMILANARIQHEFVGTRMTNPSPTLAARDQTHHDGHPGFRIDQVNADLDSVVAVGDDDGGYWLTGTPDRAPIDPGVIVIHLGTNDIAQLYDPGVHYPTAKGSVDYSDPVQRATFIAHLTARLKTLVEKIVLMRPQAHIILSSIVPMETNSFEPVSQDYAGTVKNLVIQEQREHHLVTYADAYHHFVKTVNGQTVPVPGLMSSGGIHPTPAGYQLLGRVYAAAIRAVLGR